MADGLREQLPHSSGTIADEATQSTPRVSRVVKFAHDVTPNEGASEPPKGLADAGFGRTASVSVSVHSGEHALSDGSLQLNRSRSFTLAGVFSAISDTVATSHKRSRSVPQSPPEGVNAARKVEERPSEKGRDRVGSATL